MVSGHPDWQTWAGSSIGGSKTNSATFTGAIGAGISGAADLEAVGAGTEKSYVQVAVAANDDTAIHRIQLSRISDTWVFFDARFVMGAVWPLITTPIAAGEQVRLTITNNSAGALTFDGSVTWVVREL